MALIHSPRLATIKQGCENSGLVHLDFCFLGDAPPVPHIFAESSKGSACLGESGIHFIITDNVSCERASQVDKLVHDLQSLSINGDVGFRVCVPGAGWCMTSVFFILIVRPKLLQAPENLSMLCCMFGSESTVICKQQVIDNVPGDLGFHLKPPEVEQ